MKLYTDLTKTAIWSRMMNCYEAGKAGYCYSPPCDVWGLHRQPWAVRESVLLDGSEAAVQQNTRFFPFSKTEPIVNPDHGVTWMGA